jgi:hypothetical protein
MKLPPLLASDTTAAFLGLAILITVVITTAIGLLAGVAAIGLNWKIGRRSAWGLLLVLAPVLFAAFALFLSYLTLGEPAVIAGFPNHVLIPISISPIISVPCSLLLWLRAPTEK